VSKNDLIGIFSLSFDEIITFFQTSASPRASSSSSPSLVSANATETINDIFVISKCKLFNNGRVTGYFSAELKLVGKLPNHDMMTSQTKRQLVYERDRSAGCLGHCSVQ
jgi:hypothetical protein